MPDQAAPAGDNLPRNFVAQRQRISRAIDYVARLRTLVTPTEDQDVGDAIEQILAELHEADAIGLGLRGSTEGQSINIVRAHAAAHLARFALTEADACSNPSLRTELVERGAELMEQVEGLLGHARGVLDDLTFRRAPTDEIPF